MPDRPAPDAGKLLSAWMEWERGETSPGRVISTLKTGGLRDLLEEMVATAAAASGPATDEAVGEAGSSTEAWTPVV